MASGGHPRPVRPRRTGRIALWRDREPVRTLNIMGDTRIFATGPDNSDEGFQAYQQGATAPHPPLPPHCPFCDLPQDRFPTLYEGRWVLLEPRVVVPSHTVPPRQRWIITTDGLAVNTWDAEPTPGGVCRVAHRMACPYLEPDDPWPWRTMLREENGRRWQRLFDLPPVRDLPDAG